MNMIGAAPPRIIGTGQGYLDYAVGHAAMARRAILTVGFALDGALLAGIAQMAGSEPPIADFLRPALVLTVLSAFFGLSSLVADELVARKIRGISTLHGQPREEITEEDAKPLEQFFRARDYAMFAQAILWLVAATIYGTAIWHTIN